MSVAGIVIMTKFDDDMPEVTFDENTINNLPGTEKTQFIEYVLDDYEYMLRNKQPPKLISYYKDVLSRLIKKYGH